MVKKAANPWLRGLLRAGKQQQRALSRVFTAMAAAPKPARATARPIPKPKAKRVATAPPRASGTAGGAAAGTATGAPGASAPPIGKWLASHFTGPADNNAVRRLSYWLYLPDNPPTPQALPLIVMLHGCDQSATQFADGTRMNQWAQKLGYAVLYPQQSRAGHPHRCWKWYDRATQQGGGEVGLIVGMIGKVMAQYPVDRQRIYISGLSAGAGMAHIVALHHPDLFAAIGLHSGPLFGAGHSTLGALGVMKHGASHRVDSAIEEILLKRPGFPALPTMLIQGEDDDVVRPVNQIQLMRQAQLVNRMDPAQLQFVTATRAATRASNPHSIHDTRRGNKTILRVARIDKLKHAWSGGDARLNYNCATGPDASKMLLDFFSRHRRA
ncbi:PHB depolymerase family esterase [Massilia sp. PAMC28688]|uniref:extracellular catalytic domain type 1 short-chain-length polyhydroxyalkanoate depolymerase n=1 Tax=Massilia sp. PAMC28688 TaxID=2861283 RepID=UPI001C629F68|nr:PHB depolymerase family esterase [Massilia sp. PAMC28688]QYF92095.1 PHB depolymerase family esterase [Massilia sp. PAMC28688]